MIKLKDLLIELGQGQHSQLISAIGKFRKVSWKGKDYHATLSAGDPGEYFIEMDGVNSNEKLSVSTEDVTKFAIDWRGRTVDLVLGIKPDRRSFP